jgi:hypothetical protein
VAVDRHEDVLRLEIAVDNALVVRCSEGASDLNREIDGAARWDRRRLEPLTQRAPLEFGFASRAR